MMSVKIMMLYELFSKCWALMIEFMTTRWHGKHALFCCTLQKGRRTRIILHQQKKKTPWIHPLTSERKRRQEREINRVIPVLDLYVGVCLQDVVPLYVVTTVVLYLSDKVLFFENIFKIVRFGKIRDKIIIDWLQLCVKC